MTNKELSKMFQLLADIMEIYGENVYKIRSYSNAAFNLNRLSEPLTEIPMNKWKDIPGLGKAIIQKIESIMEKGELDLLNAYLLKTPSGILDLIQIKGLGPKKIQKLWKELGISSPVELLYACKENKLSNIKGFGLKTQEKFQQAIELYLQNKNKLHLHTALQEAAFLMNKWNLAHPNYEIIPCGQLRRKSQTIDKLEFLAIHDDLNELIQNLENSAYEKIKEGYYEKEINDGPPVGIYISSTTEKGLNLLKSTGPQSFYKAVIKKSSARFKKESEINIFKKAGLPYIYPECRENLKSLEADSETMENLISNEDFRGLIHCHSNYSDGVNKLKDMAEACIEMNYEYMLISDHSKTAFYANGLSEESILKQHEEIDRLNENFENFIILKGIESDILADGSLDYDDDFLKKFDGVIASVHSNMQLNEEKSTARLIKAIEHPATRILGHLTGRLLLSREGYPVNHKKIIEACAKNNVAIELNANPYRLDIDWKWLDYMLENDVWLSVNPDAHSIEGIEDTIYGIWMARKGLWPREKLLNALSVKDFKNFLKIN
ncbi:MAG: DNA polymerase/3'-5' exonuclease PolX [Chitinophagaceae bacterium]|nr:MAG: DNA polymerase/3'-5' exonuclease PolX [Chitinophagaceae bacterium]